MSFVYTSHYGPGEPFYETETNTFLWPYESIRSVTINDDNIEILCDDVLVTITIMGNDTRDEKAMDHSSCDRSPEGCCFEHSGCGYEKCLEHYPVQKVTFECDISLLHGRIKDFIVTGWDEFIFVLANGDKVSLSVRNSLPGSDVTVCID